MIDLSIGALLLAIGLAGGVIAVLRHVGRAGRASDRGTVLVLVLGAVALGLFRVSATRARVESRQEMLAEIPGDLSHDGFVTSATCRSCHPAEHDSWHASYHRTMTQVATPDAVIGDFGDPGDSGVVRVTAKGREYFLSRDGDEFRVNLVDPAWEQDWLDRGVDPNTVPDPPRVDRRIVMTTGSHHMQTYWVAAEGDGRLFQLPLDWLNEDARWVPREDVFLRPENAPRQMGSWHDNCIQCHAVAGEQGYDPVERTFSPRVGELGIACEACHGPGGEHVRANRDPARRYRLRLTGEPDPTIVNPARLSPEASTHVCAQCHGMNVFKGEAQAAGLRYRAGDDLRETAMVLRMTERMPESEREDWPRMQAHLARQEPFFLEGRFWPDGAARISGRENNAMTISACFGGDLSCLSCHSMHASDPDDQLAAGMDGDAACLQCHGKYAAKIEQHTHHARESSGSRCTNCHMPHTTYGLLKAIRSHTIDSPSVSATLATGRQNACNLCHLDRSLGWTARRLADWYDQPVPALDGDREAISAVVLDALRGDAGSRALAAWHLGWDAALAASEDGWPSMYLGHLLDDPYAAVRYVAYRSLRRQAGFGDFLYDYVGPAEDRTSARHRAVRQWNRDRAGRPYGLHVFVDAEGRLDVAELNRLTLQRDDRYVELRE